VETLPVPVRFPLPDTSLQQLLDATRDGFASSAALRIKAETLYGGTGYIFDINDRSSYWTRPPQFKTWWKNNIERQSRLTATRLEVQAAQRGGYREPRINFKTISICLADNIRRRISSHARSVGLVLSDIPPDMVLFSDGFAAPENIRHPSTLKKNKIFGTCTSLVLSTDGHQELFQIRESDFKSTNVSKTLSDLMGASPIKEGSKTTHDNAAFCSESFYSVDESPIPILQKRQNSDHSIDDSGSGGEDHTSLKLLDSPPNKQSRLLL
jgi:hypothetical protein